MSKEGKLTIAMTPELPSGNAIVTDKNQNILMRLCRSLASGLFGQALINGRLKDGEDLMLLTSEEDMSGGEYAHIVGKNDDES